MLFLLRGCFYIVASSNFYWVCLDFYFKDKTLKCVSHNFWCPTYFELNLKQSKTTIVHLNTLVCKGFSELNIIENSWSANLIQPWFILFDDLSNNFLNIYFFISGSNFARPSWPISRESSQHRWSLLKSPTRKCHTKSEVRSQFGS